MAIPSNCVVMWYRGHIDYFRIEAPDDFQMERRIWTMHIGEKLTVTGIEYELIHRCGWGGEKDPNAIAPAFKIYHPPSSAEGEDSKKL